MCEAVRTSLFGGGNMSEGVYRLSTEVTLSGVHGV